MFETFKHRPTRRISFEEQIAKLANCGIRPAPGVTTEALLHVFDRETMEADPYRALLVCLGSEDERTSTPNAIRYRSDNIWHFDTECIEGDGSYAAIARRLRDLAQGELPLVDIADHVDIESSEARVTFQLAGKSYRWEASVEDDRVDVSVLSRFADLLSRTGKGRRFTYIELRGQDCLIGCARASERERLERDTGLQVDWLK